MKTFLRQVAEDLYTRFDGNFENLTVLFPNKRAGLFFNQALAEIATKPLWAPRCMTITELFQSMTSLVVADPIILISYLYRSYCKFIPVEHCGDFDKFYSWGEIMLGDFQDVDNNMVDAQQLFDNVADLERLTSLDYLTPEQIDAIKTFFAEFDRSEATKLHKRFAEVWNQMYNIYSDFRHSLLADGYAYEALLKRCVIEGKESISTTSVPSTPLPQSFACIGFNVLNETEKRMFKHLQHDGALFYWDYDPSIIRDEAAYFITENIKLFGNSLSTANIRPFNSPSIKQLSTTTDSAQACYAGQWLRDTLDKATKAGEPLNETAIVLCDEGLLQPVLDNLPDTTLNVTMGYPLQDTKAGVKVLTLLDDRKKVEKMQSADLLDYLDQEIVQEVHGTDIRPLNSPSTPLELPLNSPSITALDAEGLYQTHAVINRLKTAFAQIPEKVSTALTLRLLRQLISQRTIPFHGEPATGVQVMGVLETRNLDFRHIIMLSTGEGIIPRISRSSSFIPYTLRAAHGMTTIERQTSLYAYYFYRLLQRADDVTFLYNSYTEGTKHGEPSRFLLQLQYEWGVGAPAELVQEFKSSRVQEVQGVQGADDSTYQPINLSTYQPRQRRLSPSALNTYLDCPMQYYLRYIANLQEVDSDDDEGIDNSLFGTLFHSAIQQIYKPYEGGRQIDGAELKRMADDKDLIRSCVDKAFATVLFDGKTAALNGEQVLNHHVICQYVRNQLLYDSTHAPLRILALEYPCYTNLLPATSSMPPAHEVRLGGIIDRIDEVTIDGVTTLRIVDYKTSTSQQTAKNLDDLFCTERSHSSHIFQTFYYCDLLSTTQPINLSTYQPRQSRLSPALMYVKLAKTPGIDFTVKVNKEAVTDFSVYQEDFHQRLMQLIAEIQDPATPFTRTTNKQSCKYCPFKTIFCTN